jgi:hypothetical protein
MTFLYFAYKSGRRWARKRRGPSESAPIYVDARSVMRHWVEHGTDRLEDERPDRWVTDCTAQVGEHFLGRKRRLGRSLRLWMSYEVRSWLGQSGGKNSTTSRQPVGPKVLTM